MLYDMNAYARYGREAARRQPPAAHAAAERARLNPWLLWRPEYPRERPILSVAELDECGCPDLCNRDHANE